MQTSISALSKSERKQKLLKQLQTVHILANRSYLLTDTNRHFLADYSEWLTRVNISS